MSDITLTPINSGYNLQKINNNFVTLEDVINDEVLHLSGGNNIMAQELDMNGKRLLNLGTPYHPLDAVRLKDLPGIIDDDGTSVIITNEETQTLDSGQRVVVFSELSTQGAGFYVSGLDADNGRILLSDEYSVSSSSTITLAESYPAGTKVTLLRGELAGAGTAVETLDFQFDTVALMKAADLPVGRLVSTKGYYAAGDGGGGTYLIADNQSVDGYGDHSLDNGRAALLLVVGEVHLRQYGLGGNNNAGAVNAALAKHKNVKAPEGTFNFSASINMNRSGSAVVGAGRNSTVFTFDDDLNGVLMSASNLQLKNLTLRNSSGLSVGGSAISANAASSSLVDNIFIDGFYNAILLQNSQAFTLTNSAMWYFTNYGISLAGDLNNDYFFTNLFINGGARGGGVGTNTHGIRMVNKSDAMMFVNVENILCRFAMTTDQTTGNKPAFCRFFSCFFDSATDGVALDKTKDFTFDSCWFSNRPGDGIRISNSENTLFQGCTFANGGGDGAQLEATSIDTKFIGCKFISNGTAGGGNDRGLRIAANTERFIINSCEFINGAGFGAFQAVGLDVGAGCDLYSISDNLFKDNWSQQVVDSSNPTEGYWFNNIGYRTRNYGQNTVTWDGSGQATIAHGLAGTPLHYTADTVNGGAIEVQIISADSTNITIRGRNTTTNGSGTGSYVIKWVAEM